MEVIQTAIEGVVIIEPRLFNDARGYFFESFSQRDFDRLVRTVHFVQDNESKSSYGVLRGLHFQKTAIRTKQVSTRHQRRRIGRGRGYPERVAYFRSTCSCRADRRKPSSILHSPAVLPTASACSRRKLYSSINATTSMHRKARGHWHGTTRTSASTGTFLPTKSSCRKRTSVILA